MLMSYQQQFFSQDTGNNNQQPEQQQRTQPPPTLTTADMQRLRASYASRVASSSATRYQGAGDAHELAYTGEGDHALYPHHQQQQYDDRQGQRTSHGGAHGLYPLPGTTTTTASGNGSFDEYLSPQYPVASNSPSHLAVHPMSQPHQQQHQQQPQGNVSSWPHIGSYAPSSSAVPAHYQQQHHQHGLNDAVGPTTTSSLSGLPELRADFQAMFSVGGADEYNDVKILREALQDNQQQQHAYDSQQQDLGSSHHHGLDLQPHQRHNLNLGGGPTGMMRPSAYQYQQHPSQPPFTSSSSYPHTTSPSEMLPSSYSMGTTSSSSFYSTGSSDTKQSSSSLYMNLDALPHTRSVSAGSSNSAGSFSTAMMTSNSPSSSTADSPVSSFTGYGTSASNASGSGAAKKKPAASRICRMAGCAKGIRSRGLCKGHGGGRRCLTPGCEISDQGGGHCIAHGGGKRCHVSGCQKSAQSKGLCKLHGGARRCKVPDCAKNCQIKGLCRLHYSMFASSSMSRSSSMTTSPVGDGSSGPGQFDMDGSEASFV
ncbi:hypothetical protein Gpo141_00009684 [Globisporangium polare]